MAAHECTLDMGCSIRIPSSSCVLWVVTSAVLWLRTYSLCVGTVWVVVVVVVVVVDVVVVLRAGE